MLILNGVNISIVTKDIELFVNNEYINPVEFKIKNLDFEKIFAGKTLKIENEMFQRVIDILNTRINLENNLNTNTANSKISTKKFKYFFSEK